MAAVQQEPEITLAQRLASNDKSVRTKALKMLRKYINLRSQKIEGGFTSEDLLKIWKGLFYCLWMQDKPLLQEEISHKISGLIHSFYTSDNQLLYFATFLQTVKREWNGIDRLRMDKFYQLVRFMFRQAFVVLKRREWESSVVNQFLEVFTEQILQNTDRVPKGLIMHVLDLYMSELAKVGSAELTADQNLTFIDPFCKTMAKTKDQLLLISISKNIFRTIVDHAPYAIEDLMRELHHGDDDSDSGQASGEEEEEMGEERELKNKVKVKTKVKINGMPEVVEYSQGRKDDLDLDIMGSEENDGVGPVLQFDYGAIGDHLFELGSHLNTRNINRTKMYSLVKTFRDLSEGIFPQEVDDDDDYCDMNDMSDDERFNKKSKKKRRKNERPTTGDETVAKRSKACQDEQKPSYSVQDGSLNNTRENLKKMEKKDEENIEPTDAEKSMDTSCVPLKADGTPREQDMGKERVVPKDQFQHHDGQLKTLELKDVETVFQQNESDSQSHLEPGVTVKKKRRKSKKLKPNSHDVGEEVAYEFQLVLDESDGENQPDSCEAAMKQKSFKEPSGVGSTQTSTDIKALSQSCAVHKPEMASLVESIVEAGQTECGVSLAQEKTKKKNKKKRRNEGEGKMDTETNGQIVEMPQEEISLHCHLETTEADVDKIKSQGGDPGHSEASTMVRKKMRESKKLCSSFQEFGEVAAVQALLKEHNSGDVIRKLSTPQEVKNAHVTQSQLGTSTTQKKLKRKKLKSSLQEVEVAVKSPAILEDIDEHNDEISRHPYPTSEEDIITQCRLKASITKKKKGKSKKLMCSSQEVGKEVDATPQDSCAEVMATDLPTLAVEVASAEAQPSETLMVRAKKRKIKASEETGSKLQEELNVKVPGVSADLAHVTTHENEGNAVEWSRPKLEKKAKKRKQISSKEETKIQPAVEAALTKPVPQKKEKLQKKQSRLEEEAKEKPILKKTVKEKAGTEVPGTVPSDDICTQRSKSLTPVKSGKKKRGLQEGATGGRIKNSGIEVSKSVTPKKLKLEKATAQSDFVSFQGLIKPPTPIYCKTQTKGSTPLACVKKCQTPKSETKKVTFGLRNNKTTEFRKTDRSLLVSPAGSSRVAFDPQKMPVSGVLKSPVLNVKKAAAQKRATAADFF